MASASTMPGSRRLRTGMQAAPSFAAAGRPRKSGPSLDCLAILDLLGCTSTSRGRSLSEVFGLRANRSFKIGGGRPLARQFICMARAKPGCRPQPKFSFFYAVED